MSTVPLVQAFGREEHEQERFEAESSEHLEESIRNARIEAVATRSVMVISALGTAAVVLVGALQVLAGQDDARGSPGLHLLYAEHVQAGPEPGPALEQVLQGRGQRRAHRRDPGGRAGDHRTPQTPSKPPA